MCYTCGNDGAARNARACEVEDEHTHARHIRELVRCCTCEKDVPAGGGCIGFQSQVASNDSQNKNTNPKQKQVTKSKTSTRVTVAYTTRSIQTQNKHKSHGSFTRHALFKRKTSTRVTVAYTTRSIQTQNKHKSHGSLHDTLYSNAKQTHVNYTARSFQSKRWARAHGSLHGTPRARTLVSLHGTLLRCGC